MSACYWVERLNNTWHCQSIVPCHLLATVWRSNDDGGVYKAHIYNNNVGLSGATFEVPDVATGKQLVEDIIALRRQT